MMNPRIPSSSGLQGGIFSERRYECSFCGRGFRNAQALGGHMNVHRRERALASQLMELRQQPRPGNYKLGSAAVPVAVPGATALINPPGGEAVEEAHQQQDVITHTYSMRGELPGLSSSSSSSSGSPPLQASATLNSLTMVRPWTPLQLACVEKRHGSVDTELRLGLITPEIL